MKKPDEMSIEILKDGTLKVSTDEVSQPNHQSAENFLKESFRMLGGEVTIKHKHGKHAHSHTHKHAAEEQQKH